MQNDPLFSPLVVNGWTIFAHSCFIEQAEILFSQVEALRQKNPSDYNRKKPNKRLAAILKLMLEVIPQDPEHPDYRQGSTLGEDHKHWFRAKFFQQYRLFFRYHKASKIIVFGWVNDEDSLRAYGSGEDAYLVFQHMLEKGTPPDDWNALLAESKSVVGRLQELVSTAKPA